MTKRATFGQHEEVKCPSFDHHVNRTERLGAVRNISINQVSPRDPNVGRLPASSVLNMGKAVSENAWALHLVVISIF